MKYILLAITIVLMAACKKSGPYSNLVKTMSVLSISSPTPELTTYTYDSLGRLDSLTVGFITSVNTFMPGRLIGKTIHDTIITLDTMYLNGQGLITDNGSRQDTILYNSLGEETEDSSPGEIFTYVWSNGDRIIAIENRNGVISADTTAYLTVTDNRNFGLSYKGKQSTHLPNYYTITNGRVMYSYTFDAYGRVSSATLSNNSLIGEVYQYTYY